VSYGKKYILVTDCENENLRAMHVNVRGELVRHISTFADESRQQEVADKVAKNKELILDYIHATL